MLRMHVVRLTKPLTICYGLANHVANLPRQKLCSLTAHLSHLQVRVLAAVLLRRLFLTLEYKDLMKDVSTDMLINCRVELLEAIQTEKEVGIRRKICDAVAELARSSIGEGGKVEGRRRRVSFLDKGTIMRGVCMFLSQASYLCFSSLYRRQQYEQLARLAQVLVSVL